MPLTLQPATHAGNSSDEGGVGEEKGLLLSSDDGRLLLLISKFSREAGRGMRLNALWV